jgi:hypothetical protein
MTKHRAMLWLLPGTLVVLGCTITYFTERLHAQQSNLGLQKLGETHEGTTIYRMNVDGCELFIAERLENVLLVSRRFRSWRQDGQERVV